MIATSNGAPALVATGGFFRMRRGTLAVSATLLIAILYSILQVDWPLFFYPWYNNTEEFPYAQEVVRFVSLDFNQHFFDIPGTPLIAICAIIYAPVLAIVDGGRHSTLSAAAFDHLQLLYMIMRAVSLGAFAGSAGLMYRVARRFASPEGALVGAVVFVTHPILALTLYHTRIEPFAVFLVVASILLWLRGIERRGGWQFFGAGFVAGLAIAARFALLTAVLPVYIVHGIARPQKSSADSASRLLHAGLLIVSTVAVTGSVLGALRLTGWRGRNWLTDLFFLSVPDADYPLALHALASIWVLLGTLALAFALLNLSSAPRRMVQRRVPPSLIAIIVSCPLGIITGVPTIFAGANYFLASVNMFLDRNNYHQDWLHSPFDVILLYLFGREGLGSLSGFAGMSSEPGAIYNVLLAALFVAGLCSLDSRRQLLAFAVVGCAVGVLSQFGKIQGTRHISGWLPWFAIVFAAGFDQISRWAQPRWNRPILCAYAAGLIGLVIVQRPLLTGRELTFYTTKIGPLVEMAQWTKRNLPKYMPIFYICCETATDDVILSWMETNGIDIPDEHKSNAIIWFGDLPTLEKAGDGYVVISRGYFKAFYLDYYQQIDPGKIVDPYHDHRFRLLQNFPFGDGNNAFDIFEFSLLGKPRLPSGGLSVSSATYGANCSSSPVPSGYRNTVHPGNATMSVMRRCERRESCELTVLSDILRDPAAFCAKDFSVTYTCPGETLQTQTLPPEAAGHVLYLRCRADSSNKANN